MGGGRALVSYPPSLCMVQLQKKNSGMIINVVYFVAWLFKYFQPDYRLLQGIIGRPQTIASFHPGSIPPRMRKEGDLKKMQTLNSWLVPLQSLLKWTGHYTNHCSSNTLDSGCTATSSHENTWGTSLQQKAKGLFSTEVNVIPVSCWLE